MIGHVEAAGGVGVPLAAATMAAPLTVATARASREGLTSPELSPGQGTFASAPVRRSASAEPLQRKSRRGGGKEAGAGKRSSIVDKSRGTHSASVQEQDVTGVEPRAGYLRKESRRGRWQARWFEVINAYLTYKRRRGSRHVLAIVDVRRATHICVLTRRGSASGHKFAIQVTSIGELMVMQEECFFLRAASAEDAAAWVANLNARKRYYQVLEQAPAPAAGPQLRAPGAGAGEQEQGGAGSDDEGFVTGDDGSDVLEEEQEEEEEGEEDGGRGARALPVLEAQVSFESVDCAGSVGSKSSASTDSPMSSSEGSRPVSPRHRFGSAAAARIALLPAPTMQTSMWSEPDVRAHLKVRSQSYATDGTKQSADEPCFRLLAVDYFETDGRCDHICARKINRVARALARESGNMPFLYVLNFQVPGPPNFSWVVYFSATDRMMRALYGEQEWSAQYSDGHDAFAEPLPDGFAALARKFFLGEDDSFRDARFKLIPRITEGPFIVRRGVGSKPALIGKKLKQRYYRHRNYLELDIDIGDSVIAWQVTKMSIGYAKLLTIDLAFVIEGVEKDELPEQLCGCFRAIQPDLVNNVPHVDAVTPDDVLPAEL